MKSYHIQNKIFLFSCRGIRLTLHAHFIITNDELIGVACTLVKLPTTSVYEMVFVRGMNFKIYLRWLRIIIVICIVLKKKHN